MLPVRWWWSQQWRHRPVRGFGSLALFGMVVVIVLATVGNGGVDRVIRAETPTVGSNPQPSSSVGQPTQGRWFVTARWVAITDQRRDVLDLTRADVVRIIRGDQRNWADLGGRPHPIIVYLPQSQTSAIASALGLRTSELAVRLLPDEQVANQVASTPGAFALIEPERLRIGVLALTIDGHDPYRDRARASPIRQVRWMPAQTADDARALLRAFGVKLAPPFDPVGMAVTGELIPVRCTNAVLEALDDYDAMFDGVREVLLRAEIAVAPLELPLTANEQLTPCKRTITFTGSHRAVPAMSNAGLDVVLTIGNHMMDCWGGCSGIAALHETLTRLHNKGIVTVGAGENLKAARAPALLRIRTAQGLVSFAFLGYDSIAPWYAARDDRPGTAPLTARNLREDVSAAARLADHVIVGANWGIEYVANPNRVQRQLGGLAIDAGASLLIGNHPHWVQAVEHFEDALVAYSFGNFIFDQSWSVETTQGMLMELGFTAERLIGYRIRPVVIRGGSGVHHSIYRPEFVDPAGEGRPILRRIWRAQDRLPAREASQPE